MLLPDVKANSWLYANDPTHGCVHCPFCMLSEQGSQVASGIGVSGVIWEGDTQKLGEKPVTKSSFHSLMSLNCPANGKRRVPSAGCSEQEAKVAAADSPWEKPFLRPSAEGPGGHGPVLVCPEERENRSKCHGLPKQGNTGICCAGRRTKGRGWPSTKSLQNGHQ